MAEKKEQGETIKVEVIEPDDLKVMPITGAFGGLGPHDTFRINLYYDDIRVKPTIEGGQEKLVPQGVRREIQARLAMSPKAAGALTVWLVKSLSDAGILKIDQLTNDIQNSNVN